MYTFFISNIYDTFKSINMNLHIFFLWTSTIDDSDLVKDDIIDLRSNKISHQDF